MFRTRDFVLLFTIVVFLIASIGATVFSQWRTASSVPTIASNVSNIASSSRLVLTATIPGNEETERTQRLNRMREKIAQAGVEISAPDLVEEIVSEVTTSTDATSTEKVADEVVASDQIVCANYVPYLNFWDSRGLQVETREGALVVERVFEAGPQVILQLPARTMPAAVPSCLSSDVIGIANDGSLIRNDEVALYSIFGAETRIGYALDGLPIHGTGSVRGDACGGRMVSGQYRYELSADRDGLINCFASIPAQLP